MKVRALVVAALGLTPEVGWACAVCVDSAWGSRGFGWPFVGLMLAPFMVVAGLVGVLAWSCARRPGATPGLSGKGDSR